MNCMDFCCSDDSRQRTLAEARQKLLELQNNKWHQVAAELQNEDPYQFLRAYSPGSYQFYLERKVEVPIIFSYPCLCITFKKVIEYLLSR